MTGVSKNTVVKLLADVGRVCREYHDQHVRGLKPGQVQCDEIWSFCYAKAKNLPPQHQREYGYGDLWTWTAFDRDTKLIVSYHLGLRTPGDAREFMLDLAGRVLNLTQLSTDGLSSYPDAVYEAFGTQVDYAQLIKNYATERAGEAHFSPAKCTGAKKRHVVGCPNPSDTSTSHVERQNLTMRMSMRRFRRLTNAFSKKVENLEHAVALHFMYCNYCRKHQALGTTPAVAAGLADRIWGLADLVGLLEKSEASK